MSVLSSLDTFVGDSPLETLLELNYWLTQTYNLITCHLSYARARLLSVQLSIVSFISHRPSHCITIRGRGESDWTGLRSHAQWIRRYSHPLELRVQHALVFYILLLARMTSWVAHNDVYTGGGFLHFTSYAVFPRMSTCDFLLSGILHGATFFS